MDFNELSGLIKSRHSIRRWQDKDVPEELIMKALNLAIWAPNAGNRQNWFFYVVLNREIIRQTADFVKKSADRLASWHEAKRFGNTVISWRDGVSFFGAAPAMIAVATRQYQSLADTIMAEREKADEYAGKMRRWRSTANSSIQSVGSVIAYLLLALHELGLGAVWMTGPMQARGEIENMLGIPKDLDLVAIVPLGYPAESPEPKERFSLDKVCKVIR